MADIKNAIMKAKISGVLHDVMVKSDIDNVWYDETTTLAAKLAEIIADSATKANTSDMTAAIAALKQEMLGDTPVEAYNTFTELAAYIEEHGDAADALTAAIGTKADASTVTALQEALAEVQASIPTGALASKDVVAEADLDAALAEKVNTLVTGNHSHTNKDVLDGITAEKVAAWDKTRVYVQASEPADMEDGDVWLQIVN